LVRQAVSSGLVSMSTGQPGFAGDLPPQEFNLARYCLQKYASILPDKTALIICRDPLTPQSDQHWTYAQIEQAVLRLAGGLVSAGFKRGDRLFIRMGNSFDYALVFFAANAAGLVPVPASAQLSVREVSLLIKDCEAAAIISDGSLSIPELPDSVVHIDQQVLEKLKSSAPTDYCKTLKDDPAFLIYTSGTSATPKGVLHAQRAVWGRRPMYRDWYDISRDDRLLHTGAFNWTYTLGTGLFDPWANGATSIVYTGKPDINVWPALINTHQPTIMAAVPSLYRQMLKYCDLTPAQMQSLRHCLTAGEPLPVAIDREWFERTGRTLYEALGMSEISTYISSSPAKGIGKKSGSPGQPQQGRCVAILGQNGRGEPVPIGQVGVIAVHRSDPGLMLGYWNRPEEQAQVMGDDWFVSGDLAQMDKDGFIWFEGRNDDLMNAMGYRVSPIEVEAILVQHVAVDQAAVCMLNVGENTEIITGFLVAKPGVVMDIGSVETFAREQLARYKVPKKLLVVDELPCNARGKLLRKELPFLAERLRKIEKEY